MIRRNFRYHMYTIVVSSFPPSPLKRSFCWGHRRTIEISEWPQNKKRLEIHLSFDCGPHYNFHQVVEDFYPSGNDHVEHRLKSDVGNGVERRAVLVSGKKSESVRLPQVSHGIHVGWSIYLSFTLKNQTKKWDFSIMIPYEMYLDPTQNT